jgi:diazepam-binding inhibitor (GABA receptor modulator, acyl-CoA-binding protein)
MSDLEKRFAQAQQDVNGLPSRPDNDTMLKLYAFFKQATKGDEAGDPPGSFDFMARLKFDAWAAIKGTPTKDAMQQYVDLVEGLRG